MKCSSEVVTKKFSLKNIKKQKSYDMNKTTWKKYKQKSSKTTLKKNNLKKIYNTSDT